MARKQKELTVITYLVTRDEAGNRIERLWDDLPEEERTTMSRILTDRFMAAAGYTRVAEEA